MQKKAYSEQEINRINALRAEGKTWKQIAEAVGRNQKSLYLKFFKMKKVAAKNKAKRKYIRRPAVEVAQTPSAPRPMVAFIGTPKEITTSIRELFS